LNYKDNRRINGKTKKIRNLKDRETKLNIKKAMTSEIVQKDEKQIRPKITAECDF